MKTVLILGGDGFIGWPTAMKFANEGYKVIVVDNLVRQATTNVVIERFNYVNNIILEQVDITSYDEFKKVFDDYQPEHVVHLAEQRSAPHSMLDRRYTVNNNIVGTHNLLDITANTDTNIVHIGSMGVFGYSGTDDNFDPGSIYHMTKCMDSTMFDYYHKNWNTMITDLHQGIVWGWETELTKRPGCSNRFDYDGIYGTVLNRFLFQAANDLPLTVYGSGERERAFIHLEDSVNQLFKSAVDKKHETVKLFTEIFSVLELAELISNRYNVDIDFIENPRKELKTNSLKMKSDYPGNIKLSSEYLDIIVDSLKGIKYNSDSILNSPRW